MALHTDIAMTKPPHAKEKVQDRSTHKLGRRDVQENHEATLRGLASRRSRTFDASVLASKPAPTTVKLRYGAEGKESDWFIRETSQRTTLFSRIDSTPRRLYFKLRGSTLSAHPDVTYPELWRATVKQVRAVDESRLSVVIRVDKVVLTLRAEHLNIFRRWVDALSRCAGTEFDRFYKKERCIGKGHFSQVFLATDRITGDKFAVKVIKRDKEDSEKSRKFVRREVKILSITDHPNIVKAVDFFAVNGKPHFVMEYIRHGSLRDLIRKHSRLSEAHARAIMRGILKGVAYLHAANIIHRDLKPENVLMVRAHHPKISDFGLATFRNDERTVHSVVGTPSYVAPEVIRNIPYGPPADIWSCGVMLYFMVTGERPFVGDSKESIKRAVLRGDFNLSPKRFGKCSPECQHFIHSLLNYDQHARLTAEEALRHPWIVRGTDIMAHLALS